MSIIEEFIIKSNSAATQDEVFALYQETLRHFGFDSVVYSLVTDHPSINRKKGHGVTGNYPKDWMDYYIKNGYFEVDPVPRFVFTSDEAQTWDYVISTVDISRKQRSIMEEAKDARLLDGVVVPLHGINNEIAGVGMACTSGRVKPDKNMLCVLRAITQQFHLAYSRFDRVSGKKYNILYLTPRERDILNWIAEGKSYCVIGTILSISENTVKFHLRNILCKLQVSSRQTAVVKAIQLGIINPVALLPIPK